MQRTLKVLKKCAEDRCDKCEREELALAAQEKLAQAAQEKLALAAQKEKCEQEELALAAQEKQSKVATFNAGQVIAKLLCSRWKAGKVQRYNTIGHDRKHLSAFVSFLLQTKQVPASTVERVERRIMSELLSVHDVSTLTNDDLSAHRLDPSFGLAKLVRRHAVQFHEQGDFGGSQ
jgi:hypothetical protein